MYIYGVEPSHIEDFHVITDLDEKYEDAILRLTLGYKPTGYVNNII